MENHDQNTLGSILRKIGLIDSEIKLYLGLLELGPQGANVLSKKTDIKRANVYYFLEGLKEKGLITQFSDMQGIKHFRAEAPERLLRLLDLKKEELDQIKEQVGTIIPELKGISRSMPNFYPKVRFYEGERAIRALYTDIFSAKEIRAIVNIDHVSEYFSEFAEGLSELIPARGISMRELIVDTKSARTYVKGVHKDLHRVKILPKRIQIDTDELMYEGKVAFIFYRKIITACVIDDDITHDTQKHIFEELWLNTKG